MKKANFAENIIKKTPAVQGNKEINEPPAVQGANISIDKEIGKCYVIKTYDLLKMLSAQSSFWMIREFKQDVDKKYLGSVAQLAEQRPFKP